MYIYTCSPLLPPPLKTNFRPVMKKCSVLVPAAFMHVRDNIDELGKVADETNLLFLKGLLDDPVVESLVRVSSFL